MMPDYVQQVMEIYRNFATQAGLTQSAWQDAVGKHFYERYVDQYKMETDNYIQELNECLVELEKCQQEMYALGGIQVGKAPSPYNDLIREGWSPEWHGKQPGNLNAADAREIMNQRVQNRI